MDLILRGYHVNDPTWLYLSFLLILAVYFKFSRLFSVRNLDLILLLAISPGLLLVANEDATVQSAGYGWLFAVSGLLLVRVLADGLITRRPKFEQNMNAAGMTFLCAATFLFLTTKLLTEDPPASTVEAVRKGKELVEGERTQPADKAVANDATATALPDKSASGPGTSFVAGTVAQLSKVVAQRKAGMPPSSTDMDVITARLIAIFAHFAVILGLALVGRHIFGDPDVGFAMATLYMLLPCTAYDVGKIDQVLPAALVVWAIWAYRRPFVSGILLGLASAMMFFPIVLLPLWVAFYGRRGGLRFGAALGLTTAVILSSLLLLSPDTQTFMRQMLGYFPWMDLQLATAGDVFRSDFWGAHESAYRVPVIVAYVVMLVGLTIWPRRKSLAHVIPCSAALVIGTQFWYQQGGVYVLWYLPLLLLVVFRPLMTNHFAPELKPIWFFRRAEKKVVEAPQPELVGTTAGTGSSTF